MISNISVIIYFKLIFLEKIFNKEQIHQNIKWPLTLGDYRWLISCFTLHHFCVFILITKRSTKLEEKNMIERILSLFLSQTKEIHDNRCLDFKLISTGFKVCFRVRF